MALLRADKVKELNPWLCWELVGRDDCRCALCSAILMGFQPRHPYPESSASQRYRLGLLDKSIPFVAASVFSHSSHPHKGAEMTSGAPPAGDKRVCWRAPLKDFSMCIRMETYICQNIWHFISNEQCQHSTSCGAALSLCSHEIRKSRSKIDEIIWLI